MSKTLYLSIVPIGLLGIRISVWETKVDVNDAAFEFVFFIAPLCRNKVDFTILIHHKTATSSIVWGNLLDNKRIFYLIREDDSSPLVGDEETLRILMPQEGIGTLRTSVSHDMPCCIHYATLASALSCYIRVELLCICCILVSRYKPSSVSRSQWRMNEEIPCLML